MSLAQVLERLANLAEEHQVANVCPRTSAGAIAVAAALAGGVLWYIFRAHAHPRAAST